MKKKRKIIDTIFFNDSSVQTGGGHTFSSGNVALVNQYMPSFPFFGTLANSVDPDQMPQNAAADQGLHCLLKLHTFL